MPTARAVTGGTVAPLTAEHTCAVTSVTALSALTTTTANWASHAPPSSYRRIRSSLIALKSHRNQRRHQHRGHEAGQSSNRPRATRATHLGPGLGAASRRAEIPLSRPRRDAGSGEPGHHAGDHRPNHLQSQLV